MQTDKLFLQSPVRNESVVGAQVYSLNGEFSPQVIDLTIPARGISFQFIRKYRSTNHLEVGALGRGWTFTYAKSLGKDGNDILYHDGLGRIHCFKYVPSKHSYTSPDGFYAVLDAVKNTFFLRQRYGGVFVFEKPERGGRLLAIKDRNGNVLQFKYGENEIQVIDSFERKINLLMKQGRIIEIRDHAKRAWRYKYNDDGCLVEVIHPPTKDTAKGSRTQYTYDDAFRLRSITDPNGQVFLQNSYDDFGRISQQKHGNGTFNFEYETIGKTDLDFPIYKTHVRLKNGALLDLKHDASGHVVERTLFVSGGSLSPEDQNGLSDMTVPVITTSRFNRHGEVVQRTHQAGNIINWTYDEGNKEIRAQGNLLETSEIAASNADNDQTQVATQYTYEPVYQQVKSIINPRGKTTLFEYDNRGNLAKKSYPAVTVPKIVKKASGKQTTQQIRLAESFEYNKAGQLIRSTDTRGVIVEYFYHPIADPGGAKSHASSRSYTQKAGGYPARIVRDVASNKRRLKSKPARLTAEYGFDVFGNLIKILDGKRKSTHFKYDARNRVVRVTSREPFSYEIAFRYDANDNLLEATTSFEHQQYDAEKRAVIRKSTTVRRGFEYNALNNVVYRTVLADGREIAHTVIRDANENIVREIQPMGNVIEYEYDERGLLISKRFGAGTRDEAKIRYTYTSNGRLRSTLDGRGNTVHYNYDGFHRYKGFVNARGTVKKQWFDETGNVTRVQVQGDFVSVDERGEPVSKEAAPLLESWFQYDELNRRVRIDRAWNDPLTSEPMGKSQWDGKDGVVSTVIEYDDNHLPSKIWQETGNVLNLQYDGANRSILVNDETGESVAIEYDENSNPVRLERLGPIVEGDKEPFRQTISQEFDELDRLVTRSLNGAAPEIFAYNSLGLMTENKNEAGVSTKYLHDGFGRLSGRATTATVPHSVNGRRPKHILLQRVEWDDNNRLIGRVNAANHSTRFTYDTLNRLNSIIYADGTSKHFERDGNGNTVRRIDPNRTIITNRFDVQDRLTERLIKSINGSKPQLERFHYDGLNRLVAAVTASSTTLRRHDSLSRLLEVSQSGRTIRYGYDSAGNRVSLIYPSGQDVHKSFDLRRRVTEVRDGQSVLIASYKYGLGTQLRELQLGNVVKATFEYEPGKGWLNSIIYRSADTGEIIEGYKYLYDAVGNRVQEVQLRRGRNFGSRYFYDSANRLIRVQYGVERLSDPDSQFEHEVLYELSNTGIWQLKTTRDARGQMLEQVEGAANQREAYVSLGDRHFEHDANGNRILEGNEHTTKRYGYDYANRIVLVENMNADGMAVQTIEYGYDAFNHQVLKRITKDGETREYIRVWNGSQLIEEWEDGKLIKSFTYGGRINEPLTMSLSSTREPKDYHYLLNGGGSVAGLTDQQGKLVEAYHYDVFGQPFLTEQSDQEVSKSILSSTVKNPLLANAQLYDLDTGLTIMGSSSYDAGTGRTVSADEKPPGPWIEGYEFGDDAESLPLGGMSGRGGVSTSGKGNPYDGGWSDQAQWDLNDAIENGWNPSSAIHWLKHHGITHGLGHGIAHGFGKHGVAGLFYAWFISQMMEPSFGDSVHGGVGMPHGGGHGNGTNSGSGHASGGNSGSSSSGAGGNSSGGFEGHPLGNGVDYGHEGGGGTRTEGGSTKKDEKPSEEKKEKDPPPKKEPEVKNEGMWVNGKWVPAGTPNPIDGGGEDVDKDWWRNPPNQSIFDALKPGLNVDEGLVTLPLEALGGRSMLTAPQLIIVNEGGEDITLNLEGVQSTGSSAGTTTDGWGDKPRTMAEALIAPRIRDAATSRF